MKNIKLGAVHLPPVNAGVCVHSKQMYVQDNMCAKAEPTELWMSLFPKKKKEKCLVCRLDTFAFY